MDPSITLPPLHESLSMLEQTWREWDERFAQSPSVMIAVEQTRCFARHTMMLARERAMLSSLRMALVREGAWTPRQALDSCLRYPPNECGHSIDLLPMLPDELIPAVVEHTRAPAWRRHVPFNHPGVWVTKRAGGESLLSRLCARLAAMNLRSEAEQLFADIEHVGARIDALEALHNLLSPDEYTNALAETLTRCRALDPIRRLHALCELSRLHPPARALALVEEAIAGLPPGHDWTHTPGGLMLMMLGEPVILALDREGLREHLAA